VDTSDDPEGFRCRAGENKELVYPLGAVRRHKSFRSLGPEVNIRAKVSIFLIS